MAWIAKRVLCRKVTALTDEPYHLLVLKLPTSSDARETSSLLSSAAPKHIILFPLLFLLPMNHCSSPAFPCFIKEGSRHHHRNTLPC